VVQELSKLNPLRIRGDNVTRPTRPTLVRHRLADAHVAKASHIFLSIVRTGELCPDTFKRLHEPPLQLKGYRDITHYSKRLFLMSVNSALRSISHAASHFKHMRAC
jgi:hypothetical protein